MCMCVSLSAVSFFFIGKRERERKWSIFYSANFHQFSPINVRMYVISIYAQTSNWIFIGLRSYTHTDIHSLDFQSIAYKAHSYMSSSVIYNIHLFWIFKWPYATLCEVNSCTQFICSQYVQLKNNRNRFCFFSSNILENLERLNVINMFNENTWNIFHDSS